jgi:hypothetical protein
MFTAKSKLPLSIFSKSDVFRRYCQKATKGKFSLNKKPTLKTYGQPTHETHPQLLSQDEITPSIKRTEFQERRQRLMEQIASYVSERNSGVKQHLVSRFTNILPF